MSACKKCRGTAKMNLAWIEPIANDVTVPLPSPTQWYPPGVRNPITEPAVHTCHGLTCDRCKGTGVEP